MLLIAPFVGSFLGVVVARLPKGESIVAPRSHCPECGSGLGAVELIPLISWLIQRGRCRRCGQRIDVFHPMMELGAITIAVWAFVAGTGLEIWFLAVLGWLLLALAAIDQRDGILPNGLVALVFATAVAELIILSTDSMLDSILGSVLGFGFLAALALAYERLRGIEGLGWGDAKFMGAAGMWVGWQGLPSVLLLASAGALAIVLAGSLRGKRVSGHTKLPFGPYLCFATWLVQLYGPVGI
ncbi:MAG: prepilin peptidase [Sphingomonadales bacterium]